MRVLLIRFFCMALLLLTTGCSVAPVESVRNALNLDEPYLYQDELEHSEAWNTDQGTRENGAPDLSRAWWVLYDDSELETLMGHAFRDNPQINQVQARITQAQALKQQNRADIFPALNAQMERGKTQGDSSAPSQFSLIGAANYELDLWGKNRATYKSGDAQLQASQQDLYATAISLGASITENWLEILSLIEQERLLNKQIDVNRTVLELQSKRFEMGNASALDILQQRDALAQSESQLPDILSQQRQAANALALLLGKTPRSALKISEKPLPDPLAIPEIGLPSHLLQNRPDVQAAWQRLGAADWAAHAAWANRLPSFNLSATYSSNANTLGNLFNVWALDMVGNITAPIIDAGSRKATEQQQRALADERFQAYREVVLNAVGEVENALVRNTYQDQKIVALDKQLMNAKNTLINAQTSYTNGDSTYINVLSSLNNTQNLERQLVREKLAQAIERVRLYRALGGTHWVQDLLGAKVLENQSAENIAVDKIEGNKE